MSRTDIPDELASVLQAAADGAPAYHGDLDEVRGRGRAVRRRRTGTVAGLFVAALAAVLAIPVTIGQIATPPAEPTVEIPTGPGEPVGLLLFAPPGMTEVPLHNYGELRPDGSTMEFDIDVPGIDGIVDVTALPGGRLAAIGNVFSEDAQAGLRSSTPQVVQCGEVEVATVLLVIEPDGSASLSRELDRGRSCDGGPHLLGGDAHNVYLRVGSQMVAHSLASGAERVLVDTPEFGEGSARASVAGGRIAMVLPVRISDSECEVPVRVTEVETGDTREYQLPPATCSIGPFQLSPDGRYAAAAADWVSPVDFHSELRVVILDLDTGDVVVDRFVVSGEAEFGGSSNSHHHIDDVAGMTWDDERTLRVAWYMEPVEAEPWIDAITATELSVP